MLVMLVVLLAVVSLLLFLVGISPHIGHIFAVSYEGEPLDKMQLPYPVDQVLQDDKGTSVVSRGTAVVIVKANSSKCLVPTRHDQTSLCFYNLVIECVTKK